MVCLPVHSIPSVILASVLISIVCVDRSYAIGEKDCPAQTVSESLCPTLKGTGPNGEIRPLEDHCQNDGKVYKPCRMAHRLPVML